MQTKLRILATTTLFITASTHTGRAVSISSDTYAELLQEAKACKDDKKALEAAIQTNTLAAPDISTMPAPATAPAPAVEPNRTQEKITAKVGETFTVTLDYNPTTGVAWFINIAALETSPIQYVKQEYVGKPNPGKMVGVGGQLILYFKAVNPGSTLIRLSAQGFGGEVYRQHAVGVTIQ